MRSGSWAVAAGVAVKLVCGVLLLQATPAFAAAILIPLAQSSAGATVFGTHGTIYNYYQSGIGPQNSFAYFNSTFSYSAQAIVSPNPSRPYVGSPSVSISAKVGPDEEMAIDAEVDYYFVISSSLALTNPAAVGIDVTGTEYASGGFYAGYSILSDQSNLGARFNVSGSGPAQLSQNRTFVQLAPNVLYTVMLEAGAIGCGPGQVYKCDYGASSGNAYVDPYFTLDPSTLAEFPDAQLLLSSDVPNFPDGVPEPSSWGLMMLGLGFIGWRLRRSLGESIVRIP